MHRMSWVTAFGDESGKTVDLRFEIHGLVMEHESDDL